MNKRRIKVLFIYITALSSFIRQDLEILNSQFEVIPVKCGCLSDLLKILKYMISVDLCYIWFGSITSAFTIFFAKLLNKKTILIAGGMDVANEPKINYGAINRIIYKNFVVYSFNNADRILAVSNFAGHELERNVCKKKYLTVYNAVNSELFFPNGEKEDIVITVGGIHSNTIHRKGLEAFIRSARYFPELQFLLIGKIFDDSIDYLKSIATPNVNFTDQVDFNILLQYYQRAKVYVQVSAYEAFGVSLVEAMLCECVPVVSNCAALPEIVNGIGILADRNDPEDIAKSISLALEIGSSSEARIFAKKRYSIEGRKQKLISIIDDLIEH